VQIKDHQQFLTILAIAAISVFALDKIVRPPLMKLWTSRSARIKELHEKVNEGELLMRRKDFVRGQWAQMQAGTLPNDTTVAEQKLFTGLNLWSQSSGISINSITPQWKQNSDKYKTLECRVDATGSIDNLARFLYALETDPMALKVQSVELTAASRDNDGQQLALGLQVSALVLTPAEQRKP